MEDWALGCCRLPSSWDTSNCKRRGGVGDVRDARIIGRFRSWRREVGGGDFDGDGCDADLQSKLCHVSHQAISAGFLLRLDTHTDTHTHTHTEGRMEVFFYISA